MGKMSLMGPILLRSQVMLSRKSKWGFWKGIYAALPREDNELHSSFTIRMLYLPKRTMTIHDDNRTSSAYILALLAGQNGCICTDWMTLKGGIQEA